MARVLGKALYVAWCLYIPSGCLQKTGRAVTSHILWVHLTAVNMATSFETSAASLCFTCYLTIAGIFGRPQQATSPLISRHSDFSELGHLCVLMARQYKDKKPNIQPWQLNKRPSHYASAIYENLIYGIIFLPSQSLHGRQGLWKQQQAWVGSSWPQCDIPCQWPTSSIYSTWSRGQWHPPSLGLAAGSVVRPAMSQWSGDLCFSGTLSISSWCCVAVLVKNAQEKAGSRIFLVFQAFPAQSMDECPFLTLWATAAEGVSPPLDGLC